MGSDLRPQHQCRWEDDARLGSDEISLKSYLERRVRPTHGGPMAVWIGSDGDLSRERDDLQEIERRDAHSAGNSEDMGSPNSRCARYPDVGHRAIDRHPALMGKVLVKELLLNVTIGAIPGAVWQILFFFTVAALTAALGPVGAILLAALIVGTGVMLCNFACTHAINKASGAIDQRLGWDIELENLKKQSRVKLSDKIEPIQPNGDVDSSEVLPLLQPVAETDDDVQALSG